MNDDEEAVHWMFVILVGAGCVAAFLGMIWVFFRVQGRM